MKKIENTRIDCGLCRASNYLTEYSLYKEDVFHVYYEDFCKRGVLFDYPYTYKDLKPRIDFMQSEIKDLKQLLKKGYTHV